MRHYYIEANKTPLESCEEALRISVLRNESLLMVYRGAFSFETTVFPTDTLVDVKQRLYSIFKAKGLIR